MAVKFCNSGCFFTENTRTKTPGPLFVGPFSCKFAIQNTRTTKSPCKLVSKHTAKIIVRVKFSALIYDLPKMSPARMNLLHTVLEVCASVKALLKSFSSAPVNLKATSISCTTQLSEADVHSDMTRSTSSFQRFTVSLPSGVPPAPPSSRRFSRL